MSDESIKAAVQEVLEVLRKHDLSAFFILQGRSLCETRWRFATWSCFEQAPAEGGTTVRFRTQVGGSGQRRPKEDIQDSVTIAYSFAMEIGKAALPAIGTWEELKKKLGATSFEDFRGAPPRWDLL